MTPADLEQLRAALAERHGETTVTVVGNAVHIEVRGLRVQTPPTMDYTALDWREWLHRANETIGERRR